MATLKKTAKPKVGVIGAGAWGTAVASLLADTGHNVTVWGRDARVLKAISSLGRNPKYLLNVQLSKRIKTCSDLSKVLSESTIIVCAVPTQQIRGVFEQYRARFSGKVIISLSKGIEIGTNLCVSEIFASLAPDCKYAVLSGPSFALEVAKKLPTAVTIACKDDTLVAKLQLMFSSRSFRIYSSSDVVGVELSGALKNVIAVAAGMVSGLQLGFNAQAAIINRGIVEMARMGSKKGASPMTFFGLSGLGDLVLTCTGSLSRNRRLGILLGQGIKIDKALDKLEGVAEGYFTANAARQLSRKLWVEMPITEQVHRILSGKSTPRQALTELMTRDLKDEWGS